MMAAARIRVRRPAVRFSVGFLADSIPESPLPTAPPVVGRRPLRTPRAVELARVERSSFLPGGSTPRPAFFPRLALAASAPAVSTGAHQAAVGASIIPSKAGNDGGDGAAERYPGVTHD
jgi:hypothetical protein